MYASAYTQKSRSPCPPSCCSSRETSTTSAPVGMTELSRTRLKSATPQAISAASKAASRVGPEPAPQLTRIEHRPKGSIRGSTTGLIGLPALATWAEYQFGKKLPPFASYLVVTPNDGTYCLAEITASGTFW